MISFNHDATLEGLARSYVMENEKNKNSDAADTARTKLINFILAVAKPSYEPKEEVAATMLIKYVRVTDFTGLVAVPVLDPIKE